MSYFGMKEVLPKEGKDMSSQTVKVAISLPRVHFKAIEDVRQKLHASRSAVIDEAVRYWLESHERRKLIEKYEQGYLAKPEAADELKAFESAQIKAIAKEDW